MDPQLMTEVGGIIYNSALYIEADWTYILCLWSVQIFMLEKILLK